MRIVRPFEPFFANPHLLTLAGNFWTRPLDTARFPVDDRLWRTAPDTQVRVQSQRPAPPWRGAMILVHGLEGSGESGYMRSLSQAGLEAGYAMHRFHMRTCGGTAHLTPTLYHAGMTGDLLNLVEQLRERGEPAPFLVGFSLGGNVVLKLAGELSERARGLIRGVCAVSVPIDLAASAARIGAPQNVLYERRFVRRMCQRLLATGRYRPADLRGIRSIWEIDDRITAPHFGFGTAERYYSTQSAQGFMDRIRVPCQLIQAKDDTFIPFDSFRHPALDANPFITLIAPEKGGHLGFIARRRPRFWLDGQVLAWVARVEEEAPRE